MTNKQIENKMDLVLEQARKDYAAAGASLETYQSQLDAAETEMAAAVSESDLEAYSIATAKQSDAKRAVTLYEANVERLETEALMTVDDVKTLHEAIEANYSDTQSKIEDRLKEIAAELDQMRLSLEESAAESNRLLHKLQYDVGRGIDLRYGEDGRLAWNSGKWTVTPLHGRYGNVIGLLQKLTSKDVEKLLG